MLVLRHVVAISVHDPSHAASASRQSSRAPSYGFAPTIGTIAGGSTFRRRALRCGPQCPCIAHLGTNSGRGDGRSRAAAGSSHPERAFLGAQVDTDRWLVRGTLIASWRSGPWQFKPRASVGYIEENQEAYTSSLGVDVPSQRYPSARPSSARSSPVRFASPRTQLWCRVSCSKASGISSRTTGCSPSMI